MKYRKSCNICDCVWCYDDANQKYKDEKDIDTITVVRENGESLRFRSLCKECSNALLLTIRERSKNKFVIPSWWNSNFKIINQTLYLCDGKIPECEGSYNCRVHFKDGECMYTSDKSHALNKFKTQALDFTDFSFYFDGVDCGYDKNGNHIYQYWEKR